MVVGKLVRTRDLCYQNKGKRGPIEEAYNGNGQGYEIKKKPDGGSGTTRRKKKGKPFYYKTNRDRRDNCFVSEFLQHVQLIT